MSHKQTEGKKRKLINYFVGTLEKLTEVEIYQREEKYPIERSTLVVKREDGQTAFFEVRRPLREEIEGRKLESGDLIKVGYVMLGSEKNNKFFNNLFVNTIELYTDEEKV